MRGYFSSVCSSLPKMMTRPDRKSLLTLIFLLTTGGAYAQDTAGDGITTDKLTLAVLMLTIVVVVFVVYLVGEKLLSISYARVRGIETYDESKEEGYSVLPSAAEIVPTPEKSPLGDGKVTKLKRGFDIAIAGRPVKKDAGWLTSPTYAVKPKDFIGMLPIPKMLVEVGDEVKAGDKLFYDKKRPNIFYSAPVSGEVTEIRRAEKRSIAEVIILADAENKYKAFDKVDAKTLDREAIIERLLESGAWPSLRQRPFDVVADPTDSPKAVFISGFDTAPLAANYNFTMAGKTREFQAGVDALGQLAPKVHLSLDATATPCDTFANVKGVEKHWFKGPHPAGAVGVQIHHIDPVNKGEIVWYLSPDDVVAIGRLFADGEYNTERMVAVGGPEVKKPVYYHTYLGANIENLVKDNLNNDHVRVVSGNVLTGKQIEKNGYLGYFNNNVSVIEEGDFYELLGWLLPGYARPSISPTFPWGFYPNMEFDVNTNTHGEERAFVVTGQYESVTPMDIYPQHLLKAIMARDFEKMEGLGIYEVGEEDLALCEFVCTSKVPVQAILRDGLDYMREQS